MDDPLGEVLDDSVDDPLVVVEPVEDGSFFMIYYDRYMMTIYNYNVMESSIPVIIIQNDNMMSDIPHQMKKEDGIIILTDDDLQQGADVFALTLVHIQENSTLIDGDDVLNQLTIESKHVRHHIETLARQMLIDTREYEYRGVDRLSVRDHCLLAIDRMMSGYHFLYGKAHISHDDVYDLSSFKHNLLAIIDDIDRP